LRFKRARAASGSAGPVVTAILAEQRSDKYNDRKQEMPNGPRHGSDLLRAAMPMHNVCDVKQRHAAGLAGIGNREDGLQIPVEIDDGNDAAFHLKRLVLGIPPAMGNARGEHTRLTGSHLDRSASNDGAQHASDDLPFLALKQVNMQRRAFSFGRNAAFDLEDDLIAVAHAAHDEDFAGVAIFQTKGAGCKTGSVELPRRSIAHLARKDTRILRLWRD
jgi:hypothetical protein